MYCKNGVLTWHMQYTDAIDIMGLVTVNELSLLAQAQQYYNASCAIPANAQVTIVPDCELLNHVSVLTFGITSSIVMFPLIPVVRSPYRIQCNV